MRERAHGTIFKGGIGDETRIATELSRARHEAKNRGRSADFSPQGRDSRTERWDFLGVCADGRSCGMNLAPCIHAGGRPVGG